MRSIAAFRSFLLPSKVSFWVELLDLSSMDSPAEKWIIQSDKQEVKLLNWKNCHITEITEPKQMEKMHSMKI